MANPDAREFEHLGSGARRIDGFFGRDGVSPGGRADVRVDEVLDVTVDPNPIPGTQNELTLAVSATYTITITETAGLGGEMVFVSAAVYEPSTGRLVALNYYDAADLVVYHGGKRLEPLGTLVLPQTTTYTLSDYTKPANLVVSVQLKDDRTNLINTSLLVKIE